MSNQVSSVDSLIGLELSHYRIIEKIGSGGMGVVYRARDAHLDREVAIKVLSPGTISGEVARNHLRKEALALSKLNHPNISTVYDFDSQRAWISW
jgi:eukaryotic-like serine/threonine-protein kinase